MAKGCEATHRTPDRAFVMTTVPADAASAIDSPSRARRVLGLPIWAFAVVAIGVIALVVAAGAVVATGSSPAGGPAGGDWYTVERRDLTLTLTASGELESRERVEVKSRVRRRTEIIEVVDEGVRVKRGDLLVRLDSEAIQNDLEQEMLNVESARSEKVAAEQNFEVEKNEAESRRRDAELELELAELELQQWRQGDVPTKQRELQLALEKARRNVERTTRDLEASRELYAQEFISLNDLEDAEIAKLEAEDALVTAKNNIEVYEQYTHRKQEQEKVSKVAKAKDELQRVIRKNEIQLTRHEADVNSKRSRLTIREDRLAELREELGACEIHAPQDGLVIYGTSVGSRWNRRDPISEGRQVRFNETIIILPDTSRMMGVVRVHEAMLAQVNVGQPATVTIDALADTSFTGEVLRVAVTAEDGGWLNPNLREYEVDVSLPLDTEADLKPAMRCVGEIMLGEVEDATVVPLQAVFAEEDQRFVYTAVGGGRVARQPIEIGRSSDTFVEIVDGLTAGQRVLLREPRPNEVVRSSDDRPEDAAAAS